MHSGSGRCRVWLCRLNLHPRASSPSFSSHLKLYDVAAHVRLLASTRGAEPATKPGEGLDVLKVGFSISRAHRATAITDDRRSHSYGELLHSSFQLSLLLQSLLHGERQLPVANTSLEAHGDGVNEIQHEGSKTLGVYKKTNAEGEVVVVTERSKKVEMVKGARIGIMGHPSAEFVAGMWGTWLSGAVAVPLALHHPEAELLHVLSDAGVSIVFATEEYQALLEPAAEKCGARFYLLPSVASLDIDLSNEAEVQSIEKMEAEVQEVSSRIRGEQAALIIYTSGTTGKPKGAVHTHASIEAQVQMLAKAWEYSPKDRFLHCLPLHHVHGLVNILLAPLFAGATIEFLPKFSTWDVWRRWQESYSHPDVPARDAVTVFSGVPTIYVRLLQGYDLMDIDHQKSCSLAASKLRLMMCGSSALPEPVMEKWERVTGHRLLERYGMTEFGMGLSNPLHGERRPGFVGEPLPGVEALIVEEEGAASGVGNLCIRSPGMFCEYWNLPQVTEESFRKDGFFETGDTVTIENGYYKILGRTSVDIIKSGGYKISSLEIEAVLLQHPVIAECVVLGIPDKDYGEVISAVIIPHETQAAAAAAQWEPVLTLEALRDWARPLLAPYKIPQHLLVWESLPRNAMGKVNKKDLKTLVLSSFPKA